MGKFRSILLLCLGFLLVHVRGQRDFDLADALDHPEDPITRKPTVIRRPTKPVLNNDLHLGDALGGGDISRKPLYPPLPPRPGSYSNSGGFDDSDLLDGKPLAPHITGEEEHNFNHGGNTDSGLIAGVTSPIISAFVILVVGSIAAYSAYRNKKLCFKPHVCVAGRPHPQEAPRCRRGAGGAGRARGSGQVRGLSRTASVGTEHRALPCLPRGGGERSMAPGQ
ncbi:glycoprotein Xg [Podargus strigoides]